MHRRNFMRMIGIGAASLAVPVVAVSVVASEPKLEIEDICVTAFLHPHESMEFCAMLYPEDGGSELMVHLHDEKEYYENSCKSIEEMAVDAKRRGWKHLYRIKALVNAESYPVIPLKEVVGIVIADKKYSKRRK